MNWVKDLKTSEKDRKRDKNSLGKEESQKRSLKADRAKDRGQRKHFVLGPEFYMEPQRALGKRTKNEKEREEEKFATENFVFLFFATSQQFTEIDLRLFTSKASISKSFI